MKSVETEHLYKLNCESLEITKPVDRVDLYELISLAFPAEHSIHPPTAFRYPFFQFQTHPFTHGRGEGRLRMQESLPPGIVRDRIDTICSLLTICSLRKNGKPELTVSEAYEVFSVIACNWLSIHGCLGVDGHGRALLRLLPLTLAACGYSDQINRKQFYKPDSDEIDMFKSTHALIYLNGHLSAGKRILAAYLSLIRSDDIDAILLDPMIIFDPQVRKEANSFAQKVIFGGFSLVNFLGYKKVKTLFRQPKR